MVCTWDTSSEFFASCGQDNSIAGKLEVEKEVTGAVEKHNKEPAELVREHQRGPYMCTSKRIARECAFRLHTKNMSLIFVKDQDKAFVMILSGLCVYIHGR